jgi:predicted Zn-dependent protease
MPSAPWSPREERARLRRAGTVRGVTFGGYDSLDSKGSKEDGDDEEEQPDDPWSLVRLAMGSLAGEPWRLKQALMWPAGCFQLRHEGQLSSGSSRGHDLLSRTQTYDAFRAGMPFQRDQVNGLIDLVIVGEDAEVRQQIDVDALAEHLSVFTGFEARVRAEAVALGSWARPRTCPADEVHEQVSAKLILDRLLQTSDPRHVCTLGITASDLYPPKDYSFVVGMNDSRGRAGVYSCARYFREERLRQLQVSKGKQTKEKEEMREQTTACMIKSICRETLKICGMGECHLMHCLMNPLSGVAREGEGRQKPEFVDELPLSLCCICLRKLHWVSQVDLLDRYGRLPAVLSDYFSEEASVVWRRMAQVGLPTFVSLKQGPGLPNSAPSMPPRR